MGCLSLVLFCCLVCWCFVCSEFFILVLQGLLLVEFWWLVVGLLVVGLFIWMFCCGFIGGLRCLFCLFCVLFVSCVKSIVICVYVSVLLYAFIGVFGFWVWLLGWVELLFVIFQLLVMLLFVCGFGVLFVL